MDKRTRAYRRYKAEVKFNRRLNIWLPKKSKRSRYIGAEGWCTQEELVQQIKEGKAWTWIRTTSTPCSCGCCSHYKYKWDRAKDKRESLKEAWKEIEEELNN